MSTDIVILGSTGSIGTQALDIIGRNPDKFQARVLVAGNNWKLLAEQTRKFRPDAVVIANPEHYENLRTLLRDIKTEILCGREAVIEAAATPSADTVLAAMVGYEGLAPTVSAIKKGKRIALANKETLVAGGEYITSLLKESESEIVPVDSEHSAIYQCLVGEKSSQADKIILTASGGPFRTWSKQQIEHATLADALSHPNWNMGNKVTIDSATMMNKGFEMMEARWLFDCPASKIDVAVHPQSIVHSMVQFRDGSIKAQLAVPDMRLPIGYALGLPDRLEGCVPPLTLEQYSTLTFERPDLNKFPLLRLAYEAIETGGTMPCMLNAANEIAVCAFLNGKIRFAEISELVGRTIDSLTPTSADSLESLAEADKTAREKASNILQQF